ncbi:MAG: 16S rRNA (cytidine(1402)-2'-O)-methyltransferase [Anaerolineaceae bacterium]|nr:16S rRNA (cytidine(1402)-2'-O)-methyltransferase [Anaerolineaceae bacterium]
MNNQNRLYIVATPIGNIKDITLRAIEVLESVDVIICEEYKQGSKLLKRLGIKYKELFSINEHNEKENTQEIMIRMAQGDSCALISDCGTPVFADPGAYLIREISQAGFVVQPIPGASSLMAALSILDIRLKDFYFAGFLPRKTDERNKELKRLRTMTTSLVIMDTPYRLSKSLKEIIDNFGKNQKITLACNLTQSDEAIYRGTAAEIFKEVKDKKMEFMLIVHREFHKPHKSR